MMDVDVALVVDVLGEPIGMLHPDVVTSKAAVHRPNVTALDVDAGAVIHLFGPARALLMDHKVVLPSET